MLILIMSFTLTFNQNFIFVKQSHIQIFCFSLQLIKAHITWSLISIFLKCSSWIMYLSEVLLLKRSEISNSYLTLICMMIFTFLTELLIIIVFLRLLNPKLLYAFAFYVCCFHFFYILFVLCFICSRFKGLLFLLS